VRRNSSLIRSNVRQARLLWEGLSDSRVFELKSLTKRYSLSIAAGDLQLLDCRWYVTHPGLLRLAQRRRCIGIRVQQIREFCEPSLGRWVFKATVYPKSDTKGFAGYGDADPSNVSPLVRGAEMRVAETRAVNRALRKAYGIGLCSVEELGSFSPSTASHQTKQNGSHANAANGPCNGQPRFRDRLSLLIRQHHLDSDLVKKYAAEYCGTEALREASREMVEAFITHLAEFATQDKEGLIAKLQSYSPTPEVHS
jgi:hypothetical protein